MKIKKRIKNGELFFKKHKIDEDFSDQEILISNKNNSASNIPISNKRLTNDEINDNLMEIYSDDGDLPDFKTIKIKKKKGFFLSFLYFLLFVSLLSLFAYWLFNYIRESKDFSSVLDINIVAPEKVALGEDFFYEINYQNNSNYNLNNIIIEVNYPENFILSEVYSIESFSDNRFWRLDSLGAKLSGKIKIKGRIINQEGLNNLLSVKTSYEISGLSSSFSKENFNSVTVSSLPFKVSEDYFYTVLVGEEYPLKISINNFKIENINEFIISFSESENVSLSSLNTDKTNEDFIIEKIDSSNFKVTLLDSSNIDLDFKYKVDSKKEEEELISWEMKYIDESGKDFVFLSRQIFLESIKSDLHLGISVNEGPTDFPVNFGQKLDYVIAYSNKGDKNMKDLVIMAVLESDFLDWTTLSDPTKGKVSRKTISWTFREAPELKELEPGQSGEIKFSIRVADYKRFDIGQKPEVKSYAQFSVGNIEDFSSDLDRLTDNRSNTIVNKLNSNLSITEKVLYFNEDNIPVGSGPLPPAVGEKTTFRYYWTIKNSLHELRDVKVELPLPKYVIWEDIFSVSAGNLSFDSSENKVYWNINRWPIGISEVKAEFNIGIIPGENEYNKIIILSSGAIIEAFDIETEAIISKQTDVKTSKLEDDVIAGFNNDGRVR
jgi:hypothetical protein